MTTHVDFLRRDHTVESLPAEIVETAPRPLLLTAGDKLNPRSAAAIRAALADRGALLIRGLATVDAGGAARVADVLFPDEQILDTGEHPQADHVDGLYRPVPFASDQTLLWHHENSFSATFPRTLIFICRIPAARGGATTIVDSRLVYQHVLADVRNQFVTTGVRYTRRCDGYSGRRWQQLYGTDDPAVAARYATGNGESLTIDGDTATIVADRPAFIRTPHGPSWFNQLLHWHPAALPPDLLSLVRRRALPVFRDCTYGDGEAIADNVVEHIAAIHRQHEYPITWQAGDVLLIDNTVFSHGRHPYHGPREHYVRMVGQGHHDSLQPRPLIAVHEEHPC